jgi:hypothetical protein
LPSISMKQRTQDAINTAIVRKLRSVDNVSLFSNITFGSAMDREEARVAKALVAVHGVNSNRASKQARTWVRGKHAQDEKMMPRAGGRWRSTGRPSTGFIAHAGDTNPLRARSMTHE